jgi:hypothetical protein
MKRSFLFLIFLVIQSLVKAQLPNFKWAISIGTGANDVALAIAHDAKGNVFTAGSINGGADFDPGPLTYTPSAFGSKDAYIAKYDSSGNLKWVKTIGGPSDDLISSVFIDTANYIYIAGKCVGYWTYTLGSVTYTVNGGVFVSKMDSMGNILWAVSVNAADCENVIVDNSGYVYYSGTFSQTVDFNPGSGIFNLSGIFNNNASYFSKLDPFGNFLWAKRISGSPGGTNSGLYRDTTGNIYLTGHGVQVASSYYGMYVSRLDTAGNFIWVREIAGTANMSIQDLSVDFSGNVYTTGHFNGGTIDLDPGSGTYTLNVATNINPIFMLKLDSVGNYVWAKTFGNNCYVRSLKLDNYGQIYLSGYMQGGSDFSTSGASYNLITVPASQYNGFLATYNTFGNVISAHVFEHDQLYDLCISVDKKNNIYLTGDYLATVDFMLGPGTYFMTSLGYRNIYVGKMDACTIPQIPINTTSNTAQNICQNRSTILTTNGSGYTKWYSTPAGSVAVGIGSAYSTPSLSTGTYTFYAEANACKVNAVRTPITVNVAPFPILNTVLNPTLCVGTSTLLSTSGIGVNTYSWTTGATTPSISISPTITTTYSVTGTGLNNCSSTQIVTVTVNQSCQDVWPGDANSDGTADNLDVLELGLHFTQIGPSRATTSNAWQSYFSNNWSGTITNGKNLNHSDCNGDGTIDSNDTLAIYTNYGLTHAFKQPEQTVTNPQLSIVPDQTVVNKGTWGTASVFLGDASSPISNINGLAFTLQFDQNLIDANSFYMEYPSSFLNANNQNLKFSKPDFANGKLYTATTHTITGNVSGNGKIAILHYKIKSALVTDEVLNIGIVQAKQSNAAGTLTPLTAGTATIAAIGASVGMDELNGNNIGIYPNPASTSVTIYSSTTLEKVELLSITGQLILTEKASGNQHRLNLTDIANGVYFVVVHDSAQKITRKKIVVQH